MEGGIRTYMEDNICISALIENWQIVYDFLEKSMDNMDIPKDSKMSVIFAGEEIYVNISSYAYPESHGDVTVCFEHDVGNNLLKVRFIDNGIPFDPTKVKSPDTTESVEKRNIGGLGIFIVNKIMDGMEYVYDRGQNNLLIFKKIG
jgi:anti-sigma regulatory factor (Ser/Thr protein kinase)